MAERGWGGGLSGLGSGEDNSLEIATREKRGGVAIIELLGLRPCREHLTIAEDVVPSEPLTSVKSVAA